MPLFDLLHLLLLSSPQLLMQPSKRKSFGRRYWHQSQSLKIQTLRRGWVNGGNVLICQSGPIVLHDLEFNHPLPSNNCITDSLVLTIYLSFLEPGCPQDTDCTNLRDVQMTSYAIGGKPSLPSNMLKYCEGQRSHAICTQSTLPTHPGRPQAVYSPTTFWKVASSSGM